jgi:hypothetical protein
VETPAPPTTAAVLAMSESRTVSRDDDRDGVSSNRLSRLKTPLVAEPLTVVVLDPAPTIDVPGDHERSPEGVRVITRGEVDHIGRTGRCDDVKERLAQRATRRGRHQAPALGSSVRVTLSVAA